MPYLHRIIATASLLAAIAAPASAKIEREVEKTFQVQPGVLLKVSTAGGNISVSTSHDNVVKIVAKEHIRASSEAEADDVLSKLDLKMEQSGGEVEASARYDTGFGLHFGNWPPVQVDFIVSIPQDASVELKTSGGNVTVDDLDGTANIHTSGGDIKLAVIGGEIDASTSGGNVILEDGKAKVRLETSGGNISVKHIGGTADLHTSGGDIKIDSAEGSVDAETSGGDVKAGFTGGLKGDCSLSTSGGQVKAAVSKGAAFHLDASTSGGEVDASGLTITIEHGGSGKSSLSGNVNGGGPDLKLHSSGGDIEIQAR